MRKPKQTGKEAGRCEGAPREVADLSEAELQAILAKKRLYLTDLTALMPGQPPEPGDTGHSYEATSDYIRWRRRDTDVERAADAGLVGTAELAALDEANRELTLKLPCTHAALVAWVARTGGDFVLPEDYRTAVQKSLETRETPGHGHAESESAFKSLVAALEPWFETPFNELPDDCQATDRFTH